MLLHSDGGKKTKANIIIKGGEEGERERVNWKNKFSLPPPPPSAVRRSHYNVVAASESFFYLDRDNISSLSVAALKHFIFVEKKYIYSAALCARARTMMTKSRAEEFDSSVQPMLSGVCGNLRTFRLTLLVFACIKIFFYSYERKKNSSWYSACCVIRWTVKSPSAPNLNQVFQSLETFHSPPLLHTESKSNHRHTAIIIVKSWAERNPLCTLK